MTVIYANHGDVDTLLLTRIWRGIEGVHVVEITPSTENYDELIADAIANEEDTLVICGHGTPAGLLHPILERFEYLIHSFNYQDIRARNVIGIWCHASEFAELHHVNGFFTGMFISNINEANRYGIFNVDEATIHESEALFLDRVNRLLRENVPLVEWNSRLRTQLNESHGVNDVDRYNYDHMANFDFC